MCVCVCACVCLLKKLGSKKWERMCVCVCVCVFIGKKIGLNKVGVGVFVGKGREKNPK